MPSEHLLSPREELDRQVSRAQISPVAPAPKDAAPRVEMHVLLEGWFPGPSGYRVIVISQMRDVEGRRTQHLPLQLNLTCPPGTGCPQRAPLGAAASQ